MVKSLIPGPKCCVSGMNFSWRLSLYVIIDKRAIFRYFYRMDCSFWKVLNVKFYSFSFKLIDIFSSPLLVIKLKKSIYALYSVYNICIGRRNIAVRWSSGDVKMEIFGNFSGSWRIHSLKDILKAMGHVAFHYFKYFILEESLN